MRPTLASTLALTAILLLVAATPALAKGDLEARLDAPIARDTPGGTELEVGVTVTFPDGDEDRPVEGSPVYLRLFGPDGSSTWQLGREDRVAGHYTMRIPVPAGGVSRVEVGMHGTSDLPFTVVGDAIVAGAITSRTTQLAAPATPAPTPLPRASTTAMAPAAPDASAGPVVDGATLPWLAAIGAAALGFLVLGAARLAVGRRARGRGAAGDSPLAAGDPHRAAGA